MFYAPFQHLVGKMRETQRETHRREIVRGRKGLPSDFLCAYYACVPCSVYHPYATLELPLELPSPTEVGKTSVTHSRTHTHTNTNRQDC